MAICMPFRRSYAHGGNNYRQHYAVSELIELDSYSIRLSVLCMDPLTNDELVEW